MTKQEQIEEMRRELYCAMNDIDELIEEVEKQ